jgi:two-component system LytT family response regulator
MSIRTLLVDDMQLARDRLARHLEEYEDVEIIGECASGEEAIEAIRTRRPDLVFLDVHMPQINGFDVLERVGSDAVPAVVFVTAYDQFALKAFEVNAIDYLLKPFDADRLRSTVERVRRQLELRGGRTADRRLEGLLRSLSRRPQRASRLALKVDGRTVFVNAQDVDYVEAAGNYVSIQAGSEAYLVRERLSQMEATLDPEMFVRIHRSTIVNVTRVKEMAPLFNGDQAVTLRTGKKLTVSRSFRDRFMAALGHTPVADG